MPLHLLRYFVCALGSGHYWARTRRHGPQTDRRKKGVFLFLFPLFCFPRGEARFFGPRRDAPAPNPALRGGRKTPALKKKGGAPLEHPRQIKRVAVGLPPHPSKRRQIG